MSLLGLRFAGSTPGAHRDPVSHHGWVRDLLPVDQRQAHRRPAISRIRLCVDRRSRLVGCALDGRSPQYRGDAHRRAGACPRFGHQWPTSSRAKRTDPVACQKPGLRRGDRVRITAGPFENHLAIYAGMKGSERVAVLLAMLGSVQRVELARRDIERVTG